MTFTLSPPDAPHRQYPPPASPWILKMDWDELLFEHWRVRPDLLRPLVPAGLELDTYDGHAWIAVVPFLMTGVRPRAVPPIPWLSEFPELNVRTYVTHGGRPGVWFFSLDADQPLAVEGARRVYHLNYHWAEMSCTRAGDAVAYRSQRRAAPEGEAAYRGNYWPLDRVVETPKGSLGDFLVNRYCLYAADDDGNLYRGEIDHAPWPLHEAGAEVSTNTMTRPLGLVLPDHEPLRWFSRHQEVVAWAPERIS